MTESQCGILNVRSRVFAWGVKTYLMGIVNVTPDSFSGDGILDQEMASEFALAQARRGADILDIGGESTRPGFKPVESAEEESRILPLIKRVRRVSDTVISVDTTKSDVLEKALDSGADMLNSVTGIEDGALLAIVTDRQVPTVIMHGYAAPLGSSCVDSVLEYLDQSARRVAARGLNPSSIILDPGIGFGKTPDQNIELLSSIKRIKSLGFPVLIGTSRKSTIGHLTGKSANDRTYGTAATVSFAITQGADVVRVHDVEEMNDVVKVTDAICRGWSLMVGKENESMMTDVNVDRENEVVPTERPRLTTCAIGIGSNLDQPDINVRKAVDALRSAGTVSAVSSLYRTAPWGYTEQPDFCNAVALLDVSLTARELLEQLKQLEKELGRFETVRWGPRVIDLDLLLFADQVIDEEDLRVPHPEIFNRAFVLIPLSELMPAYSRYIDAIKAEERAQVQRWVEG